MTYQVRKKVKTREKQEKREGREERETRVLVQRDEARRREARDAERSMLPKTAACCALDGHALLPFPLFRMRGRQKGRIDKTNRKSS